MTISYKRNFPVFGIAVTARFHKLLVRPVADLKFIHQETVDVHDGVPGRIHFADRNPSHPRRKSSHRIQNGVHRRPFERRAGHLHRFISLFGQLECIERVRQFVPLQRRFSQIFPWPINVFVIAHLNVGPGRS